jgi:hypothetical protein
MDGITDLFGNLDNSLAKDLIENFLLQFIIPNALITLLVTQIFKKTLQFLRQKHRLSWVKNWFYPVIALFSGIIIVSISFLVFVRLPSLWLILTFGLLIGLLASGLFNYLDRFLGKSKFNIVFWNWLWNKLGLENLPVSEGEQKEQIAAEWEKLVELKTELEKQRLDLGVRSEALDRREKILCDAAAALDRREKALRNMEETFIREHSKSTH